MAGAVRDYNYEMGLRVDGMAIPDPSVFDGASSALDSMGKRDANGLLHRKMVAEKHSPIEIEYHTITFAMMENIMSKMRGESFQFTFPDPADGLTTITAYVGDRKWKTQMAQEKAEAGALKKNWKDNWYGDLSFHVLEY